MNKKNSLAAACALLLLTSAHAADWRPSGYFVQGALAEHSTYALTSGVVWPWDWQSGPWSAITEGSASLWSAQALGGGRDTFAQVALQPLVRYRFGDGRSDWFLEGGIGISFTDKLYSTAHKQFSTRFNFVDTIGVGRSFGANRASEVSLRITHTSNASIKRPNPGENFLQLRYAAAF